MEKTNALINHLNISQAEQEASMVQNWAAQAGTLFADAYNDAVLKNGNYQEFIDQIADGVSPEMQQLVQSSIAALDNVDTTVLEERLEAADSAQARAQVQRDFVNSMIEQEAQTFSENLRARARVQDQPAAIIEEEEMPTSTPGAFAENASGITNKSNGDDEVDLVNQVEGQRIAGQNADAAGAVTNGSAAGGAALNISDVSTTPEGAETISYMQDMLTRLNTTVGQAARTDPNNAYGGQAFRSAEDMGFAPMDFQGMRNFRGNTETLIASATPEEMQSYMEDQIARDIVDGSFPVPFKFQSDNAEDRAVEAAEFARDLTTQLKDDGFFERDAYAIYSSMTDRQTVGFYPSEEGFARAANIMLAQNDVRGPDIAVDNNLGAEFFKNVISDQMSEVYSDPDSMTVFLQDRYRDMVKDGEISIYGRDNSQASLDVLDEVIADVTEQMRAGTVSGGSFIGSKGWDYNQYARLMREGMEKADLHFEEGVGPASKPSLQLQVNVDNAAAQTYTGTPISLHLDNVNLDVKAPDGPEEGGEEVYFSFDEEIEIYKLEAGGETGPVLSQIYETADGQDLGTKITPVELRALLGADGFTMAPVYNDPPGAGPHNDLLAFRVETGAGNSFYVTRDAIEDGSMSQSFSQSMQSSLDAGIEQQHNAMATAPAQNMGKPS